jgi:DNA-binding LacI/PurR family transcriptional regulator
VTKRVTLATVAEALGVSAMTVSNAYNRPEKLSEELRARVLATAAELGYAGPNPIARSLRRGHAGALGVVLGETLPYAFEDPGAVEFLRGLAGAVVASGTALHLVPAGGGSGDPALILDAAVDAFVLFAFPDRHPLVDALLQRNIPLVVQGGPELPGHPLVSVDEESAATAAVRHLQALGHTRLGAIAIPLSEFDARADRDVPPDAGANMRVSRLRLAGYRAAAPAIAIREAASNSRDRGEAAAHALLDSPMPPTAIACMSDELAIGALRAASKRGVQLSVVGWDDTPAAERARLTTIHQSLYDHGRLCAELATADDAAPGPHEQPWRLVVRESTAPLSS